jgi:biotin operon repressor
MKLFMTTHRWQNHQRNFLKQNYGKLPTEEIAKILNKSEAQIHSQVYYLRKRGWRFK